MFRKLTVDVVGARFIAPVVAVVNVAEIHASYSGRDKSGPYDVYG